MPYCGLVLTAETPKRFYPEELVTLGDHIRKKRLDEELTQRQLAELLEVTASTINNWEKGRSAPTLQALPRLIKFLGYDPTAKEETNEVLRIRRSLGLTQEAFAARLHVDPCTVARWERDESRVSSRHRALIEECRRDRDEA